MRYGEAVRRAAGNSGDADPDKDVEQLDSDKKPVEKECVSYCTPKTVMF